MEGVTWEISFHGLGRGLELPCQGGGTAKIQGGAPPVTPVCPALDFVEMFHITCGEGKEMGVNSGKQVEFQSDIG